MIVTILITFAILFADSSSCTDTINALPIDRFQPNDVNITQSESEFINMFEQSKNGKFFYF